MFELFIWTHRAFKEFSWDKAVDLFLHAPQYYDSWWRNLLNEAPQHVLIETGLILFIVWLIFIRRTVDPGKISKNEKLSAKEIEWLLDTWSPDPLVPSLSAVEETINHDSLV